MVESIKFNAEVTMGTNRISGRSIYEQTPAKDLRNDLCMKRISEGVFFSNHISWKGIFSQNS